MRCVLYVFCLLASLASGLAAQDAADAEIRKIWESGDYRSALALAKTALADVEKQFEPDAPETLFAVNRLAFFYNVTGQYDLAAPLYKRALEARERVLGPEHPDTIDSVNNLAALYDTTGRYGVHQKVRFTGRARFLLAHIL